MSARSAFRGSCLEWVSYGLGDPMKPLSLSRASIVAMVVSTMAVAALATGCKPQPSQQEASSRKAPEAPSVWHPGIDAGDFAQHVRTLASDAFEGRAPGSVGEER